MLYLAAPETGEYKDLSEKNANAPGANIEGTRFTVKNEHDTPDV